MNVQLNQVWQNVQEEFYYPQIPKPKLVPLGTATIDMIAHQIHINPSFVESIKVPVSLEKKLDEILAHEVTHFTKYPSTPLQLLRMHRVARKLVSVNVAHRVRVDYSELQVRLSTSYRDEGITDQLYNALPAQGVGEKISRAILAYTTKKPFLHERQYRSVAKRVSHLPLMSQDLETFCLYIKEVKKYHEDDSSDGNDGESGDGKDSDLFDKNGVPKDFRRFELEDVLKALQVFAQETPPKEFEEIAKELFGEEQEESGKLPGKEVVSKNIAKDVYSHLSKKFFVDILPKPTLFGGGLYPKQQSDFSVGDSLKILNPHSSPGVFPGITKKWEYAKSQSLKGETLVPDVLFYLDNSGSMPDVGTGLSTPVLVAHVLARNYHSKGARVAAVSFGGYHQGVGFTRDLKSVFDLFRQESGGGTTFDAELEKKVVRGQEVDFDVVVLSDMMIDNLDYFTDYLRSVQKTKRIHLIWNTYSGSEQKRYIDTLKELAQKDTFLYNVTTQKDIETLRLGGEYHARFTV